MVQQQCNRDKSDDACNICGKKGHWHRECPELNGNKRFNSKNKSARNNPGRCDQQKGNPGCRTPPKDGENEIKHVDGKKFYWCKKCHRWTQNAFGTCLDSIARNSNKMVEILCDLSKICSKPK